MNAEIPVTARNHYRPEDYFTYNVQNGVIRNQAGTRMLTVPEEFLSGLHYALEDETGSAASIVLYKCGRWWGKQFAARYATEMRQFYQKDAGEVPLAFYLQVLRRVWALYGWGTVNVSLELSEHGFVEVFVDNAPYSQVVGDVGRHTELLMAGVLASLIGQLAGRELEASQTTCTSKGDRQSVFLIGDKNRIEVIRTWVKQGRGHTQIVEAIRGGELS